MMNICRLAVGAPAIALAVSLCMTDAVEKVFVLVDHWLDYAGEE